MYYEVYIDIVFVTNLFMDYILLRFVGKIFRCGKSRKRAFLAAVLGSLFSCFILCIPADDFLPVVILLHGACASAMICLGCGLKKGGLLFKAIVTLYMAAFLCGGFWEVVSARNNITFKNFVLIAAVTYMGLLFFSYLSDSIRIRAKNIYPVTLSYQGKTQSFYGFYDSGNLLLDPVNGEPVSILEPDILKAMLSEELTEKLKHLTENPGELQSTEAACLHPHFLTYRTIGRENGLMLAVTLEKLCIQTPAEVIQVDSPVFALAFEPFALSKEYKVLLNSRLLQ